MKLVVIGCPRSGTSLATNLIRSAGFDIDHFGQHSLMKPNEKYNPDGFFERIDIVECNDRIISAVDHNSSFLNPPSFSLLDDIKRVSFSDKVCIEDELNSYDNWVIKDARLCFTLHSYNINDYKIIWVVRNPNQIKKSMIDLYGDLFDHDIMHHTHYVKQISFNVYYAQIMRFALWQTRRTESLVISYEDLLRGRISDLESFIEHTVDKTLINTKYQHHV